jgi:hypothetical protein
VIPDRAVRWAETAPHPDRSHGRLAAGCRLGSTDRDSHLRSTDASLVKTFMGRDIEGVADVDTQLRLIADKIMPEFS